jgi:hypothetical protein
MVKLVYQNKRNEGLSEMKITQLLSGILLLSLFVIGLTACSPEVGSDAWCSKMKETPSGDWSTNQATDFAKHCLLK